MFNGMTVEGQMRILSPKFRIQIVTRGGGETSQGAGDLFCHPLANLRIRPCRRLHAPSVYILSMGLNRKVHGDQLNMAVFFWYLVISD